MANSNQDPMKELEAAFSQLKRQYGQSASAKAELNYKGNSAGRSAFDKAKKQLKEVYSFLLRKSTELDNDLKKNYPEAYQYAEKLASTGKIFINNAYNSLEGATVKAADIDLYKKNSTLYKEISSTLAGSSEAVSEQGRAIIKYLDSEIRKLNNELHRKYPETMKDIEKYIQTQAARIQQQGIGHPWGTECRREIAALIGLEQEIDSLYELGLASLLHSQSVSLKGEFIDLLRNDPKIKEINDAIKQEIVKEIKDKMNRNNEGIKSFDGKKNNLYQKVGLGGKRHPDDMMKQLMNIMNFDKYKATWEVGLNKLTWTLRHTTVYYDYKWYSAYNQAGYTFIYKVKYHLEDILDLRPHSSNKIDFNTPYNICTSILGSAYHGLIGASDTLKVKAEWNSTLEVKPTKW